MKILSKDITLINFLIFLFPILIGTIKVTGNLILLILVVYGIYLIFTEKINPFKDERTSLISIISISYFFIYAFSIFINHGFDGNYFHLGRKLHYLLIPFLCIALLKNTLDFETKILSTKLGSILMGLIALIELNFSSENVIRASGMINANIFADIAALFTVFSVLNFFDESKHSKVFSIVAVIFGLIAVIGSGSRGSWISLFGMFVIYFFLVFPSFRNFKCKFFSLIGLSFISIMIFFLTPSAQDRLNEGIHNTTDSISNIENQSSVGERILMWRAGFEAFKESPIFGYGYRSANKAADLYAPTKKHRINDYTHLHNEYLTTMVSSGVLGLISLFSILLLPLRRFFGALKQNSIVRKYGQMGLILLSGYSLFGISHIAFGEEHINAVFIFFIGISFLGIYDSSITENHPE